MINTNKLKGRMAELGLVQSDLASTLKIASPTISQKINGIRPLTLDEAEKIATILRIEDAQFGDYFFARPVA